MRDNIGKFRGKRVDNGEWVYGDLIHGIVGDLHIQNLKSHTVKSPVQVIPDTVGEFTGLKDWWEGDLLEYDNMPYVIIYDNDYFGFVLKRVLDDEDYSEYITGDEVHGYLSLGNAIGNLHDQPELMQPEEERGW